jgi:hypothetical protein
MPRAVPRVPTSDAEARASRDSDGHIEASRGEHAGDRGSDGGGLPPWRRIARKVLIGLAIAVVGLYALYVLAANIALKTRIIRDAVGKFPSRSIEYSSAWTLWPGIVHVKDLHIRVQDSSQEFLIVLDDTVTDLDLLALTKRRLHARFVKTHGLSFRLRSRIDPRIDPSPVTYALPPIEGFDAVPFKDVSHYEPPPLGKELEKIFTFDLENVEVDGVREIWVDDYRVEGDGHVRGRLHLAPSRNLEVGRSELELTRGSMWVGKDVVIDDMKGKVAAEIGWFQVRSEYGADVLEHLTVVDAALDGHVSNYSFVEHRYLAGKGVELVGGEGRLHLDVHVRNGELINGTAIGLDAKDLELHFGNRHAKTSGVLAFDVKDREGAPEAQGRLTLTGTDLFVSGSAAEKTPTLTAAQAGIFARSRNLGLAKPFNDLLYSVDVPALKLGDLRVLQRFLPPASTFRIGKGTATAHLHLDATRVDGGGQAAIQVESKGAFVRYRDASLQGNVAIDLKLANLDLAKKSAILSHSTLDVTDVTFTDASKQEPAWWAHFDLEEAALHPAKKDKLTALVAIKMRDVRPILRTYAAGDNMPGWLAKMLTMENFFGRASLRLNDGFDLEDFRARSEDAGIGAQYHSHRGHVRGKILLEYKGLDVGLDIGDGGSKPVLLGAYDWYTGGK